MPYWSASTFSLVPILMNKTVLQKKMMRPVIQGFFMRKTFSLKIKSPCQENPSLP